MARILSLASSGVPIGEGPALPAGWLSSVKSCATVEDTLQIMVGCPPPPGRSDLEHTALPFDLLTQQLAIIKHSLLDAPDCPKGNPSD